MRRIVVLGVLLGLMALLQTLQAGSDTAFNPLSLATFGFILLAAYTLGQVAANVQLPKITGYIVTGLVFGPQIFNIFSSAVEADLRVVNDLAIGLIALSAGAEMQLQGLKRIARSLLWIVLIKSLLILVAVTGAVFALSSFLPFLAGQPTALVLSVGMILGVIAIGTSPAATIAVITETGAKGRLADTTLGVAVAKDIVMVVLLALGIALARTFSPDGHGFELEVLWELALELGLSLFAGVVLGAVIIAYIRYVGAELWLFVVGVTFAMTAVAHEFHLEALLVFIVAGFVVQNASALGHDFVHLVEKVALPVYVVFFSVAGAGLDLGALRSVLPVVLALVVVRLLAIFVGTSVATRIAGEPEPIRRYAWLSFVAQAGVVIGLSIIVENNLPGLGAEIRTLVMGTVAIHLLLGPVLFKLALTRAGEVRGAETDEETPTGPVEPADEEIPVWSLPEELEDPVLVLETQIAGAVAELAAAADSGPLRIAGQASEWSLDDPHAAIQEQLANDMLAALERFWRTIHQAALDAPRQVRVQLEQRWFRAARWDSTADRWIKRHRRFRRAARRLSGSQAVLYRTAPVRALALYHLDNALAEDLAPVLATLAAQPALTLRARILASRPADDEDDDPEENAALWEIPMDGSAHELLGPVVETRLRKLRRELGSVGTAELPARRRRPSTLHERAQKARVRTVDALEAWNEFGEAVIQHEWRREAVDALRETLRADAGLFQTDLEKGYASVVEEPLARARTVLGEAHDRIAEMRTASSEAVEEALLAASESVSVGLRRQALASLRRSLETRPLDRLLKRFDDHVEDQLETLPESFRVVAPRSLPDPARPPRTYPEPASHEFRLIATGAVERTLRPTLAQVRERAEAALRDAAGRVQEVRAALELRFDAAVDAAMDEVREDRGDAEAPSELRESLQIATIALRKGLSELEEAERAVRTVGDEAVKAVKDDFDALIDRLETHLASASPLEARLQAERARVELSGTAVLRLVTRRIRQRLRAVAERFGLGEEQDPLGSDASGRESPRTFRPAGRAGSDRAVLFQILFDDTSLAGKIFDGCLILTILASIGVLMLESVEPIRLAHGTTLTVLEWLFTLVFTVEYAARLWVVARPARYALSFFGIIDLLAVVPTYLSLIIPGGRYLMVIRVLRVARAFRVLKLARHVGEAQVLLDAMKASRPKITVFLVYVLSAAVVTGSAMYLIEGPEAGFTSIPRAVYWSIVTLTTVGFGDITPQSPLGQTLAAILMVLGYGIIAVPTGIVTAELASRPAGSTSVQSCPKCGHEEPEASAAYCSVCGAALHG